MTKTRRMPIDDWAKKNRIEKPVAPFPGISLVCNMSTVGTGKRISFFNEVMKKQYSAHPSFSAVIWSLRNVLDCFLVYDMDKGQFRCSEVQFTSQISGIGKFIAADFGRMRSIFINGRVQQIYLDIKKKYGEEYKKKPWNRKNYPNFFSICDTLFDPYKGVTVDKNNPIFNIFDMPTVSPSFQVGYEIKKKRTPEEAILWKDIIGNDKAKQELREAVETPVIHKELFEAYGQPASRGCVLHGPPGCGKTMLVKACAYAMSQLPGNEYDTGFISVKGPEIMNFYLGKSEENVRELFKRAREHKQKTGHRALLFVDEADALFKARESSIGSKTVDNVNSSVVTQFLSEMDGLEDSAAFIVLATNRLNAFDTAVLRDGRIDSKIHVRRPNRNECFSIAQKLFVKSQVFDGVQELTETFDDCFFGKERSVYKIILKGNNGEGTEVELYLKEVVTGAMVANIVRKATMSAMRRDIAEGCEVPSGLKCEDVKSAVESVYEENKGLNRFDDIMEKVSENPQLLNMVQADGSPERILN